MTGNRFHYITYRAHCSCGWSGADWKYPQGAEDDGDEHHDDNYDEHCAAFGDYETERERSLLTEDQPLD